MAFEMRRAMGRRLLGLVTFTSAANHSQNLAPSKDAVGARHVPIYEVIRRSVLKLRRIEEPPPSGRLPAEFRLTDCPPQA